MQYKHYPVRPERLTASFVGQEFEKLARRISHAEDSESSEEWVRLYADWNALKSYLFSEGNRRRYALSRHLDDAAIEEADRYFREEITPVADEGNSALVRALLSSRHRRAVAERYGEQLLRRLELMVGQIATVNSDLRVRESELLNRYNKLAASGEFVINGQKMGRAVAWAQQSSSDASVRREAFISLREWVLEHRAEFAEIFDELVKVRHRMARNLGYENFIPLCYKNLGRADYDPDDVARFRQSIRQYVVPLLKRIYERHAQDFGVAKLSPWDAQYHPSMTLPLGIAPVATQLEKAQRVFDALSPRLGQHFMRMCEEDLIDLENRPGKMASAFSIEFTDEGRVAIFCNSTGNSEDVRTLMHEMGHAFQAWESLDIEAIELQVPTAEVCEIHSDGMEFLSLKYMTEFFDEENAARFRREQWMKKVYLFCYVAVVDEFQHWVYENAEATPDERDAAWSRIWDTYHPGLDFSGMEPHKRARWYLQEHIFRFPFYYIDYQIADMAAMQIALIDIRDSQSAMEAYMKLCRMGGTFGVLDTFKAADLRSPFEPELLRDLMAHAAQELGVNMT